MRVLISGAGRMGLRHAQGAIDSRSVSHLTVSDISADALSRAREQLGASVQGKDVRFVRQEEVSGAFDTVIVAATASDRIGACRSLLGLSPRHMLVEKPLGQSLAEVERLVALFSAHPQVQASVNLNMRMYPFVRALKSDLHALPQFSGMKYVNFTGGTLGIGANGIHYLDLLFHLLDADAARIEAAAIDDALIPSGRGPAFGDFGGWACIQFTRDGAPVGKSILLLSAESTVFGGWEVMGPHGRIRLNELEGLRTDILRKAESALPMNRYAGDYLPPVEHRIETPMLGDLTRDWLDSLAAGTNLLPTLGESLKVHRLMFDWLSHSRTHKDIFPIT